MSGRIEAIVFDMDGLLFDSERIVQRSWNMAGEALGIKELGNHIYHTIGLNLKSRTEYFYKAYGPDFPNDAFVEGARTNFRKIADAEGVPLMPGVKELLEYGKEHGYRMAVATSSRREYSTRLMKDGGIYDYFHAFVFGDMVKNAKPDPEIYLAACAAVQADPCRSVALEDSPHGIRSAHAAGMYPVMVPNLVNPDEDILKLTYRKIDSLHEMCGVLEEMEEGICLR